MRARPDRNEALVAEVHACVTLFAATVDRCSMAKPLAQADLAAVYRHWPH
jgi:hypothetical protein